MSNPFALPLAEALDPVIFARRIELDPDSWQAEVLRSGHDRTLLLCSRQVGKSTIAALKALHRALTVAGSLVLIAAPSQRQSVELFRTVMRWYRALGRPVPAESENTQSLVLENGSRIVSLPGDEKTTRGYAAVSLLIIDEAARVDDDFYQSILPTLAVSRGQVIAMSTPFGRRGWFWRAATSGAAAGWHVVSVRADECARLSPEYLAQQLAEQGEWMFRQEWMCEFVAAQSAFFDPASIAALLSSEVLPLFGAPASAGARVVDVGLVEVQEPPLEVVDAVDARSASRTAAFRAEVARRGW